MQKKHLIGYPITALLAIGVGAAGGSDQPDTQASPPQTSPTSSPAEATPRATPAPTAYVTVTTGPEVTVTAPPPPPETAMAGDGIYQVGVDVKSGTYVSTPADSGNCYWARLSSADTSDIADNGNTSGQLVVTITKADKFFESSGCNDWTRR